MNSQEMWIKLYDMDTKEIQIQLATMFIFLIKDRGVSAKEIITDLKNIYKKIGR